MELTQQEADRLELLLLTHGNTLYRTAAAILGDAYEAQDAVQDAFLAWMEKRPNCPDGARERAWLLKVTVNGCKSRLRSPWRRRTGSLTESVPTASPEEDSLMETMQALPVKDRVVLHLHYYEGYQTAEIARMLGCREGTVRSRLSRARKKLKALLDDEA